MSIPAWMRLAVNDQKAMKMAKTMDDINITLRNVITEGDSEVITRIPAIMNVIPHQMPVPI